MESSVWAAWAAALPACFLLAAFLAPHRRHAAAWVTTSAIPIAMTLAAACRAFGPGSSATLGVGALGLSFRLDALSATLGVLISVLGAVIYRFSLNYLDGDARHGRFLRRLCLTLAAVATLALAGNLYQFVAAWIAMSLGLHQLLLHYPQRERAVRAAHRKYMVARTGDACLVVAAGLLIHVFGTADIGSILERAAALRDTGGAGAELVAATLLLAVSAMLKSAQFPSHSWLLDVVETPTPVSALLHAGVVNAGGFAIIRFAEVMLSVPAALTLIAAVGAVTALLGSAIMLTQTSVKVTLAYSTIGQMGFMMLQCGLGAFSAAAVHLVAHSIYKAHAFLSSGEGVIAANRDQRWPEPDSGRSVPGRITTLALALAVYALVATVAGMSILESPVVAGLGALFVMGLWLYVMDAPRATATRLQLVAITALSSVAYVAVHRAGAALLSSPLPATEVPGPAALSILLLTLAGGAALVIVQSLPLACLSGRWQALRVHLSHGLYTGLYFDRLIGAHRRAPRA